MQINPIFYQIENNRIWTFPIHLQSFISLFQFTQSLIDCTWSEKFWGYFVLRPREGSLKVLKTYNNLIFIVGFVLQTKIKQQKIQSFACFIEMLYLKFLYSSTIK
jgi:hypothetical protein